MNGASDAINVIYGSTMIVVVGAITSIAQNIPSLETFHQLSKTVPEMVAIGLIILIILWVVFTAQATRDKMMIESQLTRDKLITRSMTESAEINAKSYNRLAESIDKMTDELRVLQNNMNNNKG